MNRLIVTTLLLCGLCVSAHADIWKWVDANGKTYFVDTTTPIFTWVDEFGKAHYSDTPGHEDAVSVELVWHSSGTLADVKGSKAGGRPAGQLSDDEKAQSEYCQRATEVYESYMNAPQLYRTNENGEREYLSQQEAAATIAETKAKRDQLCS